MRGACLLLMWTLLLGPAVAETSRTWVPKGECVIVCGGVSLRSWERLRLRDDRHDNWWKNFVRASTIRTKALRREHGDRMRITWLVHRPSYVARGREERQNLLALIKTVEPAYGVKVRWVDTSAAVISYVNDGRSQSNKILSFDYFGHSNKYCLLLDYSSEILGASKHFIHVRDLSKISSRAFAPGAHIQSWGCFTGQYMSQEFLRATGHRMLGATGKTDYSGVDEWREPFISTPGARWRW